MQILLWTATSEDCPIPSLWREGGRCSPRLSVWTLCEVKFVEIHISQLDEQMKQKQMNRRGVSRD